MLRWKNIPIDRLSEDQLRQALMESVALTLQPQDPAVGSFNTFLLGLLAGGLLSAAGILMASTF